MYKYKISIIVAIGSQVLLNPGLVLYKFSKGNDALLKKNIWDVFIKRIIRKNRFVAFGFSNVRFQPVTREVLKAIPQAQYSP